MKKYLSFFRMRLIAGLQYRTAAWAGISTQAVWGGLYILLYRALYLAAPERLPMEMQALCSYVWIQQALFSVWNPYAWEGELFTAVQTGTVAYELLRPADLYVMWTVRTLALRLSRGALRMAPILLLGALLPAPYGLRLTVGPAAFGAFLLSFFLTLFLCACLTMLCYGLTFYVTDPKGVISIFAALSEFFSGGALPLPFFPPLLRRIAELSPFGSLQNVPMRLFGGDIAGAAILPALGLQALWCVVLAAAGYALLRRGLRRTVIAGG